MLGQTHGKLRKEFVLYCAWSKNYRDVQNFLKFLLSFTVKWCRVLTFYTYIFVSTYFYV